MLPVVIYIIISCIRTPTICDSISIETYRSDVARKVLLCGWPLNDLRMY